MSYIKLSILLLIFAGMIQLENFIIQQKDTVALLEDTTITIEKNEKSLSNEYSINSSYDFDVDINPAKKIINVNEEIFWYNNSSFPTKEIHLHLYANAFRNNKTEFMLGKALPEESRTGIEIKELKVNSISKGLVYFQPDTENEYDSTVAKIILDSAVKQNDFVKINIIYSMKIPRAISRMGYLAGESIYFIAQWFPKIGVYKNGNWICNQYHSFTEFFSDFANYSFSVNIPEGFTIVSNGVEIKTDNPKKYKSEIKRVHDFVFMAVKDIKTYKYEYVSKNGRRIQINSYLLERDEDNKKRFTTAVKNALEYLEDNVGEYPYDNFTLIGIKSSNKNIGGMEYPALITYNSPLFASEDTQLPEKIIIHETCHQYFYGLLASNEVTEAWLDEGFAEYFTTKILNKYYPQGKNFFYFFGYYPVFGLNYLQIAQVPIVYSLQNITLPEGAISLKYYYDYAIYGTLADSSYKYLNEDVYYALSYCKAEIFLLTLERFIGCDKLMDIMKLYYRQYKYRHPTANDFFSVLKYKSKKDLSWLIDGFYYGASTCDYKILNFSKRGNNYSATFFREGEAKVPQSVAVYTNKDTLYFFWNGKDRIKTFSFLTENNVEAVELDPDRKNLFDINFANNSYTTSNQYAGSFSFVMRWFFWMQNFLMIMGGLS